MVEKIISINGVDNNDGFTTLCEFNVPGLSGYTVYFQQTALEGGFASHRFRFKSENTSRIPVDPVGVDVDRFNDNLVLTKADYRSTVMGVEIHNIIDTCREELDRTGISVTIL